MFDFLPMFVAGEHSVESSRRCFMFYTHQDRVNRICASILLEHDREKLKALSAELNKALREADPNSVLVSEKKAA